MYLARKRVQRVVGKQSDIASPSCTVTSSASSPTINSPIPITITFSEPVTGFIVGDITVGNGSAGNFSGSGSVYTTDITPTVAGIVTVDINAGVCSDFAGNLNTAATQFSITSYLEKINDAFTGTNGTDIASHSISPTNTPSATWANVMTAGSRFIKIQSNRSAGDLFSTDCHYGLEAGENDVIITAILRLASTTLSNGVLARMDNLTANNGNRNCWVVSFGNGTLNIIERNASPSGTVRATTNLTTNAAQDYSIKVECIGSTITVYIDGVQKLTYGSMTTHLTSTKHGILIASTSSIQGVIDDYKIFF